MAWRPVRIAGQREGVAPVVLSGQVVIRGDFFASLLRWFGDLGFADTGLFKSG